MAHLPLDHGTPFSRTRGEGIEYGIYFALVFAISLPKAIFRMAVPRRGQPRRFFVTEALSMAREVTPMIFSV